MSDSSQVLEISIFSHTLTFLRTVPLLLDLEISIIMYTDFSRFQTKTPGKASQQPGWQSLPGRHQRNLVRPLPPQTYMHTLSQLDTAIKLKGFVNSDCQLPNGFYLHTKHNCFLSSIILSSRHSSMLVYVVCDFWLMAFLIHFRVAVLVFCLPHFQPHALIWNLRPQAQCLSSLRYS